MIDSVLPALGAGIFLGLCAVAFKAARLDQRRIDVHTKYGDTFAALRVMHRGICTGQTAAQLRDSLGNPTHIERTRSPKQIWKYVSRGDSRRELTITLDHGIIVEWDWKNL